MRKMFCFALLSFSVLVGCLNAPPSLLLAGLPDAPKEALLVTDGQGPNARFGTITGLEIDSQGNLYILDMGPEIHESNIKILTSATIRKVTPEGKVTTLIGREMGQTLIGNLSMIIRQDILYTSSAGCLLKADLKKEPLTFTAFYGTCLTIEELTRLQEQVKKTDTPIPVENIFEYAYIYSIMPEKAIYFYLSPIGSKGPSPHFKIFPDEKIVQDSNRRYFPAESLRGNFVINSQGMMFGISEGLPGPGRASDNVLYQVSFQETLINALDFKTTPIYADKLTSPGALAVDNMDYLYVLDSDSFKRFSPQGEMRIVGRRQGEQGPVKGPMNGPQINAQRTWLYFASSTAVYKIPLPPPVVS